MLDPPQADSMSIRFFSIRPDACGLRQL